MQEKYELLHEKIQKLLENVNIILQKFREWMMLQEKKEKVNREIHSGLQKIKKIYDFLPSKVADMIETLQEMNEDTKPNKKADYYDIKSSIESWLTQSQ